MPKPGKLLPIAFLWPTGDARPPVANYIPPVGGWWHQLYAGIVANRQMTPASLDELNTTSRAIASALARPNSWDRPTPWKGLIVGAVQSGKTLSMMGVSAVALDAGFKIVVVLAGMKNDLREQTARRFNTQLMLQNDLIPGARGATTLGGALDARGTMRGYAPPYYLDSHENAALLPKLTSALRRGLPAVIIIKKLPISLADLRGALDSIYEEFGPANLPTLVLDDECDDASIPGGLSSEERAVPEAIINIWTGHRNHPNVAYLGYTATSAANLLQDPDGPLYPHFVSLLRYPASSSSQIRFEEPSADNWYSGGDCFYREFGEDTGEDANFLVSPTIEPEHLHLTPIENKSLQAAFRAYFVGGAYRLALEPDKDFTNPARLPRPYSMMIHTSVAQEDHSRWLDGVIEMFGSRDYPDGGVGLDPEKLAKLVSSEEDDWRAWYERFNQARVRIYESRPHSIPYQRPSWDAIKKHLPAVFEHVRIKAVNSNAKRGDSLDYEPGYSSGGTRVPPRDIYVIAIGGSRLSRGITIEGLGISYFARWSVQRHEDTVLQMSRWLGYRGHYLEFCRLFVTPEAWDGLRELNSNDIALRLRLSELMREGRDPAYATIVFRASPHVLPTAKLGAGKIRDITFSPFTSTLSYVRYGDFYYDNEQLALDLLKRVRNRNGQSVFTRSHVQRGILSSDWDANEIADILDSIKFQAHNPAPGACLLGDHFRPPDNSRPTLCDIAPEIDPYHIAAYLRQWSLYRPNSTSPPRFNVGVSFGELTEGCEPFDIPLLNRQVNSDDHVEGGWTGSGPNWPGDYYFDAIPDEYRLGSTERAINAPGLLLLYVVHKDAVGRSKRGKVRRCHTPFFGISIPSGGPVELRVITKTKA